MILVLGASSYIGKEFMKETSPEEVVGTYKSRPIPNSVYFDATTMRLTDIVTDPDMFSHALILYAEAGIDACKADVKRSRLINVDSTKNMIQDLVDMGINPIFTSSEYVFDGRTGNYTEEDVAIPSTVYGSQKLEIEQYLAEHCDHYAVLRLAKVFGTEVGDQTILDSWLKQIVQEEEIRCASDQIFSPIHVNDVVSVMRAIIDLNASGIYHVSNAESCTRIGMLKTLVESSGMVANVIECSIKDFDFIDDRPLDLSMDPTKTMLTTHLNFKTIGNSCNELLARFHEMA